MTYLNAKKYIESAPDMLEASHSKIMELLKSVGEPHRKIKYLRLAGSNGKTVCAEMIREVIGRDGYKVGCLRMPLREEPRENICIGSSVISMDEFAEHVNTLKELSSTLDFIPSKEELLLTVALLAFKRAECDLCIIESNHFGEDPSIVLPPPFAAIICGTIPSGDTAQISRIRSYICKGIQEIVSAPQNNEAYRIISDTCYSVNCRLTLPSRTAVEVDRLGLGGSIFRYKGRSYSLSLCGKF